MEQGGTLYNNVETLKLLLLNVNRQTANGSKFAILAHGVIKMTIYINNI